MLRADLLSSQECGAGPKVRSETNGILYRQCLVSPGGYFYGACNIHAAKVLHMGWLQVAKVLFAKACPLRSSINCAGIGDKALGLVTLFKAAGVSRLGQYDQTLSSGQQWSATMLTLPHHL